MYWACLNNMYGYILDLIHAGMPRCNPISRGEISTITWDQCRSFECVGPKYLLGLLCPTRLHNSTHEHECVVGLSRDRWYLNIWLDYVLQCKLEYLHLILTPQAGEEWGYPTEISYNILTQQILFTLIAVTPNCFRWRNHGSTVSGAHQASAVMSVKIGATCRWISHLYHII